MGESITEVRLSNESKKFLAALRLNPKCLNNLGLSHSDLIILDKEKEARINYKIPKKYTSMTVHFDHSKKYSTVQECLIDRNYALLTDLLNQGFNGPKIERAVKSKEISVAHWPNIESLTDVFWSNDKKSIEKLDVLASKAVKFCSKYRISDFVSFGGFIESQQLALVGLTYAREQGRLVEIPGPNVVSYLVLPNLHRSPKAKKRR